MSHTITNPGLKSKEIWSIRSNFALLVVYTCWHKKRNISLELKHFRTLTGSYRRPLECLNIRYLHETKVTASCLHINVVFLDSPLLIKVEKYGGRIVMRIRNNPYKNSVPYMFFWSRAHYKTALSGRDTGKSSLIAFCWPCPLCRCLLRDYRVPAVFKGRTEIFRVLRIRDIPVNICAVFSRKV